MAKIVITGWFASKSALMSHFVSATENWTPAVTGSNMAASQKVEGPILTAVGSLKLVPQPKLPLVLQLQSHDGLTEGAPVLADHTEGGTCGCSQSRNLDGTSDREDQNWKTSPVIT